MGLRLLSWGGDSKPVIKTDTNLVIRARLSTIRIDELQTKQSKPRLNNSIMYWE